VTVAVTAEISGQKITQADVRFGHSELVVIIVIVGQSGKPPPGRVPRKLVVQDEHSPPGRGLRFVIDMVGNDVQRWSLSLWLMEYCLRNDAHSWYDYECERVFVGKFDDQSTGIDASDTRWKMELTI